jgi:hypothetical protein
MRGLKGTNGFRRGLALRQAQDELRGRMRAGKSLKWIENTGKAVPVCQKHDMQKLRTSSGRYVCPECDREFVED